METLIYANRNSGHAGSRQLDCYKFSFLDGWKARGIAVVTVEFQIVEGRCDSEPARHVGGFDAANPGNGNGDNISLSERTADENNLEFDAGV